MSVDPRRRSPSEPPPDESGPFPLKRVQLLDVLAATASLLSRGAALDLDAVLRSIGVAAGVDRIYLFENSVDPESGRTLCSQRFEWAHGSVSAEIDNPALQDLPYETFSDVIEDALRRGEPFHGITRELEPGTRALLEPQGILSACIVPVAFDEQLWGFVGFDDCHTERRWTDEEISYLRLVAAIIGGLFWRERLRAALASTEARYGALIESVHEIIFECDPEGRFTFLSGAWQRQLAYDVAQSLGKTMYAYVAFEARDAARASVESAIAAGDPAAWTEAPFVKRDGEERWMQVVCRLRRSADGAVTGMLGTMRDVTQRRWAQEALRQRQLDESLSTLAGGIAHDLNNVLHGMLSATELLGRRSAGDQASAALVSIIKTSGERMADMTRQLLAYARGGHHETALLDAAGLVTDALKIAHAPPGVHVELAIDREGLLVRGDRAQLFQVVLNLVVNAAESMHGRGRLRIELKAVELAASDRATREHGLAPGPYVRMTFADEGEGIDQAVLQRIFEPFFSTKGRSRGLGLAAARSIVAAHGGAISVHSERGRGSVFDVLLPRREGEALTDSKPPAEPRARGGLVLVVDDERAILGTTAQMLEAEGFRVLQASRGRDALELYERSGETIEAVLVDYLMPDMNGAELVRALRERDPDVRVVVCTGYSGATPSDPELDGVPRLEKPFPIGALLALLAGAARQ